MPRHTRWAGILKGRLRSRTETTVILACGAGTANGKGRAVDRRSCGQGWAGTASRLSGIAAHGPGLPAARRRTGGAGRDKCDAARQRARDWSRMAVMGLYSLPMVLSSIRSVGARWVVAPKRPKDHTPLLVPPPCPAALRCLPSSASWWPAPAGRRTRRAAAAASGELKCGLGSAWLLGGLPGQ